MGQSKPVLLQDIALLPCLPLLTDIAMVVLERKSLR